MYYHENSGRNWRLIVDGPRDGALNMALDDYLLKEVAGGRMFPTLRLYSWKEETVSLGYRQQAEAVLDREACKGKGVKVVRRPTGGRAVLHRQDVTYCLALPGRHRLIKMPVEAGYIVISKAVAAGLNLWAGRDLFNLVPVKGAERGAACFQASARYEIQAGGKKIMGSAQARRRGGLLQQGTLPLTPGGEELAGLLQFPSPEEQENYRQDLAQHCGSLEEALGKNLSFSEVARAAAAGVAQAFQIRWIEEPLKEDETKKAAAAAYHYGITL